MANPLDLVFLEDRPAVLVASYFRSGNHFLMNSLANGYGYVSSPWIEIDPLHHQPIHSSGFDRPDIVPIYYNPSTFADYLLEIAKRPIATILKSHLQPEFFAGGLEKILNRYVIFVIHRHPADTLRSYWQFLQGIGDWNEGPKPENVLDFAKTEPCGAILRYQMRQYPTMMHAWAQNIEGWLAAAKTSPRVVIVGYDELKSNFAEVIKRFVPVLGREPQSIAAPNREQSTWIRSNAQRPPTVPDMDALRALCRETVGATMDKLGYK